MRCLNDFQAVPCYNGYMSDDDEFVRALRKRASELASEISRIDALRTEYSQVLELLKVVNARNPLSMTDGEVEATGANTDRVMSEVRRLLLERFDGSASVADLFHSLSPDARSAIPGKTDRLGIESLRYRVKRLKDAFDLDYDGGEVRALPVHTNVTRSANRLPDAAAALAYAPELAPSFDNSYQYINIKPALVANVPADPYSVFRSAHIHAASDQAVQALRKASGDNEQAVQALRNVLGDNEQAVQALRKASGVK